MSLTDKQQDTLDFIRQYVNDYNRPPTYREIAEAFEIVLNAAYGHVKALERKGVVKIVPSFARGIVLTEQRRCPHCGEVL